MTNDLDIIKEAAVLRLFQQGIIKKAPSRDTIQDFFARHFEPQIHVSNYIQYNDSLSVVAGDVNDIQDSACDVTIVRRVLADTDCLAEALDTSSPSVNTPSVRELISEAMSKKTSLCHGATSRTQKDKLARLNHKSSKEGVLERTRKILSKNMPCKSSRRKLKRYQKLLKQQKQSSNHHFTKRSCETGSNQAPETQHVTKTPEKQPEETIEEDVDEDKLVIATEDIPLEDIKIPEYWQELFEAASIESNAGDQMDDATETETQTERIDGDINPCEELGVHVEKEESIGEEGEKGQKDAKEEQRGKEEKEEGEGDAVDACINSVVNTNSSESSPGEEIKDPSNGSSTEDAKEEGGGRVKRKYKKRKGKKKDESPGDNEDQADKGPPAKRKSSPSLEDMAKVIPLQEQSSRLALDLPGHNWLESKILTGVQPPPPKPKRDREVKRNQETAPKPVEEDKASGETAEPRLSKSPVSTSSPVTTLNEARSETASHSTAAHDILLLKAPSEVNIQNSIANAFSLKPDSMEPRLPPLEPLHQMPELRRHSLDLNPQTQSQDLSSNIANGIASSKSHNPDNDVIVVDSQNALGHRRSRADIASLCYRTPSVADLGLPKILQPISPGLPRSNPEQMNRHLPRTTSHLDRPVANLRPIPIQIHPQREYPSWSAKSPPMPPKDYLKETGNHGGRRDQSYHGGLRFQAMPDGSIDMSTKKVETPSPVLKALDKRNAEPDVPLNLSRKTPNHPMRSPSDQVQGPPPPAAHSKHATSKHYSHRHQAPPPSHMNTCSRSEHLNQNDSSLINNGSSVETLCSRDAVGPRHQTSSRDNSHEEKSNISKISKYSPPLPQFNYPSQSLRRYSPILPASVPRNILDDRDSVIKSRPAPVLGFSAASAPTHSRVHFMDSSQERSHNRQNTSNTNAIRPLQGPPPLISASSYLMQNLAQPLPNYLSSTQATRTPLKAAMAADRPLHNTRQSATQPRLPFSSSMWAQLPDRSNEMHNNLQRSPSSYQTPPYRSQNFNISAEQRVAWMTPPSPDANSYKIRPLVIEPSTHFSREPPKTRSELGRCVGCQKPAVFTCINCHVTPFCSHHCMNNAWPLHKAECAALSRQQRLWQTPWMR